MGVLSDVALLIVGYLVGKANANKSNGGSTFRWKYKIIQLRKNGFEIWFRPAWWPFLLDHGPIYYSLEEAKENLEFLKSRSKGVHHEEG